MRQLQGMDASFVALETRNSPMHIGSILIYNPETAPGGFVRFKDILRFMTIRVEALDWGLVNSVVPKEKLETKPPSLDWDQNSGRAWR